MPGWLAVALGGALGALTRYGAGVALGFGMRSTLAVNLTGALLVGLLYPSLAARGGLPALFVLTGFLGGLTTFSAFSLEAAAGGRDPLMSGFAYAVLSVGAGLLLAKAGLSLAASLTPS